MNKENNKYVESMIEAAEKYIHSGIKVLPCKNGKPMVPWANYHYEMDDIRLSLLTCDSIAILTGELFCVVDCDNVDSISWAEENLPSSPIRVVTRRGVHIYFKGDTTIRNSASAMGVDVRGQGGYVIAPPSLRKDGKLYRPVIQDGFDESSDFDLFIKYISTGNDLTTQLPSLSQSIPLIKSLSSINKKLKPRDASQWSITSITDNDNFTIDMDIVPDSLSYHDIEMEALSEGQGRNARVAQLVGLYIYDGLSKYEILNRLLTWNESMTNPLDMSELLKTMESLLRTHERNHNEVIPDDINTNSNLPIDDIRSNQFTGDAGIIDITSHREDNGNDGKNDKEAHSENSKSKTRLGLASHEYTPSGIMSIESDKADDFLPKGILFRRCLMMITGEAKTFKSFVVLDLLIKAAIGGTWLGYKFHKPLKVYYLQVEVRGRFLKERIRSSLSGLNQTERALLEDNMIITADNKNKIKLFGSDDDGLPPLATRQMIDNISRFKPDILAIDPLGKLMSVEDDNKASNMEPIMDTLLWTAAELDCALIVVHHSAKGSKGKGMQGMRGSSVLSNAYDVGLSLHRDGSTPTVEISVHNRNGPESNGLTLELGDDLILREVEAGNDDDITEMSVGVSKLRPNLRSDADTALLYLQSNGFDAQINSENKIEFLSTLIGCYGKMSREVIMEVAELTNKEDGKRLANSALVEMIRDGLMQSKGGSYPYDVIHGV